MTIDVVTPMVDDPRIFGRIAAANALSDVYAMGGTPKVALGFVGFPTDELDLPVLEAILAGLEQACAEAGCAIVGGHTIVDPEPKAGLAVTGVVEGEAWTHRRAAPGQALVLTKALGTGVIVQAMKKQIAPEPVAAGAVASMLRLSAAARDLGAASGATAATDVTGYGLLGHLKHLAEASGVRAVVRAGEVPLLEGARALCEAGHVPGGTRKNLRYVQDVTSFDASVSETTRLLLADAQTSGGLLLTLPADGAGALVAALTAAGHAAAHIGEVATRGPGEPAIDVR